MILNTIILTVVSYLAYRAYGMYKLYGEYLRYKKQGVPFNDKHGFSFFRDAKALTLGMHKDPYGMPWTEILQAQFEVSELPPITGMIHQGGAIGLSINSADFLEDIFINQNKYHTKSEHGRA